MARVAQAYQHLLTIDCVLQLLNFVCQCWRHANFFRDIISHTFSCGNGTSYETSVWYGKVELILKLKQISIFTTV